MSHLLDINVVSELRKPQRRADARVRAWVSSRTVADLYPSVITVLEIDVGIERLPRNDPTQSDRLRRPSMD